MTARQGSVVVLTVVNLACITTILSRGGAPPAYIALVVVALLLVSALYFIALGPDGG